jgi:hypothetical protein
MTKSDVIGNLKEYQDFIQLNLKKAKKFAQKSISKSYLTGCTWIMLTENESDITFFYTFRNNDQLLITKNGNVEKAKYEIIVDNNSLLIEKKDIIEHFNIVNFQDDYLILNKLSTKEYLIFANQTKFKDALKDNVLKLLIERNNPIKEIKHKEIEREDNKKISNKNDYSDLNWFFFIVIIIAIIATIFSLTKIANKNSQNYINDEVEAVPPIEVEAVPPMVEDVMNNEDNPVPSTYDYDKIKKKFKIFKKGKFMFKETSFLYEFKNNDLFESDFILSIYLDSTKKLLYTETFTSTNAELSNVRIIDNFFSYEHSSGGGSSGAIWIYQNYLDLNNYKNYELEYDCYMEDCYDNNIDDFKTYKKLYEIMKRRLIPQYSKEEPKIKNEEDNNTFENNSIKSVKEKIHSPEYFDSIEN